jgi:hypothetical protein
MEPSRDAFWREIVSAEITRILASFSMRRDGRVVDGGGLEKLIKRSSEFAIFLLNSARDAR